MTSYSNLHSMKASRGGGRMSPYKYMLQNIIQKEVTFPKSFWSKARGDCTRLLWYAGTQAGIWHSLNFLPPLCSCISLAGKCQREVEDDVSICTWTGVELVQACKQSSQESQGNLVNQKAGIQMNVTRPDEKRAFNLPLVFLIFLLPESSGSVFRYKYCMIWMEALVIQSSQGPEGQRSCTAALNKLALSWDLFLSMSRKNFSLRGDERSPALCKPSIYPHHGL